MSDLDQLKHSVAAIAVERANELVDALQFASQADTVVNLRLHLDNAIDAATKLGVELLSLRNQAKQLTQH